MFCGLGEAERTNFTKKKKEKNPRRGQTGLVGMKGHLKTYYHVKYFFAVLKPFLTETAFYAKLAGRFSGSKTKIT